MLSRLRPRRHRVNDRSPPWTVARTRVYGQTVEAGNPLADLDDDGDCDLADLELFQQAMTGPGPGCP